jgi:hypothetical protein
LQAQSELRAPVVLASFAPDSRSWQAG